MQYLFSEAGTSTEESAKTPNTTEAPEKAETTSSPGTTVLQQSSWCVLISDQMYYVCMRGLGYQVLTVVTTCTYLQKRGPRKKSQQKPWTQLKHRKQLKQPQAQVEACKSSSYLHIFFPLVKCEKYVKRFGRDWHNCHRGHWLSYPAS